MNNTKLTRKITVHRDGKFEQISVPVEQLEKSEKSIQFDFGDSGFNYSFYPYIYSQLMSGDYWQNSYFNITKQITDLIWSCMQIRAAVFSSAYPEVQERTDQINATPVYDLDDMAVRLFDYPHGMSSNFTYSELMKRYIKGLDTLGNVYIKIVRDETRINPESRLGVPTELHILPVVENRQMVVKYDDNRSISKYIYKPDPLNPDEIVYPESDILHAKLETPTNDVYGAGIIQALRIPIMIKNFAQAYLIGLYQSGGARKMFIKQNKKVDPESVNSWMESFNNAQKDPDKKHLATKIPMELDLIPGSFSPSEADLLSIEKFNTVKILAAFQVPPSLLSWWESANRATAFAGLRDFVVVAINPMLKSFDDLMTRFTQRNFSRKRQVVHKINLENLFLNMLNQSNMNGNA